MECEGVICAGSVRSCALEGWAVCGGSGWNCVGIFFLMFRVFCSVVGQELRALKDTQPFLGAGTAQLCLLPPHCVCPSPLSHNSCGQCRAAGGGGSAGWGRSTKCQLGVSCVGSPHREPNAGTVNWCVVNCCGDMAWVWGFLALQGARGMGFISGGFRCESNKAQFPGAGLAWIGVTCVCVEL